MGLDINRFSEEVDDDFKCSICLNVLEHPVHGPCGHVFCRECIDLWLESNLITNQNRPGRRFQVSGTCPVDRQPLSRSELIEAALPFRNFISRLKIKCDFEEFGCKLIVPLGNLNDHLKSCNFNPEEVIQCTNGCAKMFPRRELLKSPHNCIKELKRIIKKQEKQILKLETLQETQRSRWTRIYLIVSAVAFFAVILSSSTFDNFLKSAIKNI